MYLTFQRLVPTQKSSILEQTWSFQRLSIYELLVDASLKSLDIPLF